MKMLTLLFALLVPSVALAASEKFFWDAVPGAAEYIIETTPYNANTWTALAPIPASSCAAQCAVQISLPDTGMHEIRIGVKDSKGAITMRTWSWFVYCNTCRPLPPPVSMGMQ